MNYVLKNRSLLALDELSADDVQFLLDMAHELKRSKRAGNEQPQLRDKNIALLADRPAPRMHGALEVAANDQGAKLSFVGAADAHAVASESMKDTARVFGRLYDAIEYLGLDPALANELARHAGVPVWNGLANPHHPTQLLADYMTMQEHCPQRPLSQVRLAYLGDARRRIGETLLQGAALMGMDFRVGAPPALWPAQALIDASQERARHSGASLRFVASAEQAVQGVDFICTDAWASPQAPDAVWAERIAQLKPYQVNAGILASSGNPAVKFLHGRPSAHEHRARKGEERFRKYGSDGLEVTDEVFESPASVVADQAENRLHTIKAVLVATLA